MANPNLLNIISAYGKTAVFTVSTTPTAVLSNLPASNKVYKINSIFISNTNPDTPTAVSIDLFRAGSGYKIASTINVENDSSLVALGKDTGVYLAEGDALRCSAEDDGYLTGVISYEILG